MKGVVVTTYYVNGTTRDEYPTATGWRAYAHALHIINLEPGEFEDEANILATYHHYSKVEYMEGKP